MEKCSKAIDLQSFVAIAQMETAKRLNRSSSRRFSIAVAYMEPQPYYLWVIHALVFQNSRDGQLFQVVVSIIIEALCKQYDMYLTKL